MRLATRSALEDLEEGMVMIGADPAGNLYELGVIDSEQGPVVVHVIVGPA